MILHIANDYSGSTVYKNLVRELDNLGVEQIVYTPVKKLSSLNKNKIDLSVQSSNIIYSFILNLHWDRLFYRQKIKKIFKDIESKVNLSDIKFIHAHTWYSDGGVAYLIHKKYKIPYIVTVRNTDLNLFYKYLLHLRPFGEKVLKRADNIIFISVVYKKRLFSIPSFSQKHQLQGKSVVIPNGIDSFWVENVAVRKTKLNNTADLLFVGKFTSGKNLFRTIEAVGKVREKIPNVKLTLVGGGGSCEKQVLSELEGKDHIEYLGKINDKERLKIIYRSADVFIMPSRAESFGLVYIEALSQGIPIIYTKNEGIDGFYSNEIGEGVCYQDVYSIANAIEVILAHYNEYSFNPKEIVENHQWRHIAKKYDILYRGRLAGGSRGR